MGIRWEHPDGWTGCGWSTGNEGGGIQWGQANSDAGSFLGFMEGEGGCLPLGSLGSSASIGVVGGMCMEGWRMGDKEPI